MTESIKAPACSDRARFGTKALVRRRDAVVFRGNAGDGTRLEPVSCVRLIGFLIGDAGRELVAQTLVAEVWHCLAKRPTLLPEVDFRRGIALREAQAVTTAALRLEAIDSRRPFSIGCDSSC